MYYQVSVYIAANS